MQADTAGLQLNLTHSWSHLRLRKQTFPFTVYIFLRSTKPLSFNKLFLTCVISSAWFAVHLSALLLMLVPGMASSEQQSCKACTIPRDDSCNGNTTDCHSLIAPCLLLQLHPSLFINQADFLYILNTKIYVLSVEMRLIFLMLLRFLSCHNSLQAETYRSPNKDSRQGHQIHICFLV